LQWLFLSLLFLTSLPLSGQNWYHTFSMGTGEMGRHVTQTSDGGFMVSGHMATGCFLLKTDPNGTEQWRMYTGGGTSGIHEDLPDGGFVIGATFLNMFALVKADQGGDTVWAKTYSIPGANDHQVKDLLLLPDSGLFISCGIERNTDYDVMLARTDKNGDTLWTKIFDWTGDAQGSAILPATNGEYFVLVTHMWSPASLMRVSANGDSLTTVPLSAINAYDAPNNLRRTSDGGYIYVAPVTSQQCRVQKLDANGNQQWAQDYSYPVSHALFTVTETAAGEYVLAGHSGDAMNEKIYLAGISSTGAQLWDRTYSINSFESIRDVIVLPGGEIVMCGVAEMGAGNKTLLLKVSSLGFLYSNQVMGNVYFDLNGNCVRESNETPNPGWALSLTSDSVVQVTTTDSLGNYIFFADSGSYVLRVHDPNPYWTSPLCAADSVVLNLAPGAGTYDTTVADFPRNAVVLCPVLDVDISTPLLRRCFNNVYYVSYCNQGTMDATNASVEVTLDPFMNLVTSSIPVASQVGNTLTFNVGNVPPGDCGSFTVTINLNCSAALGQTHCVSALGSTDSLCSPPHPNWDHASVLVEGDCVTGDSVQFKIRNRGTGNMGNPEDYYITEENIMLFTNPFQLPANDSIVITLPGNGSTWRLVAGQSNFHPWNDSPVAVTVEGCGTNGSGTFSVGLFNDLPEYDYTPFYSIDCQENIGAYDPNDKRANPEGYDTEHFIAAGDKLEYHIRFQNTGTDTAFNIVVRDTLSPYLDAATVISGASSHPYSFRIYGSNIIEWTFANILLPDSNVNEPASHGFVKFMVSQKPGNTGGTVINNSADIYFDFNEPVITNRTHHTIGENFILDVEVIPGQNVMIRAYPNPFQDFATIELDGTTGPETKFLLWDVSGRVVLQQSFGPSGKLTIYRNGLSSGMYIFHVYSGTEVIGTGKLILQ